MIETLSQSLPALLTLTAMETVLGIDNIIFIAILVGRLPVDSREKIRKLGIGLALIIRVALLFSISWIMSLKEPFLHFATLSLSGRDLILIAGGLFLIFKSTFEIHHKVEGDPEVHLHHAEAGVPKRAKPGLMLIQILLLDIVFSLDSVITAVGMSDQVVVMVVAMVISMLIMLAASSGISGFVDRHPTIKILALSFLLLIGVMLVAEGFGTHVSKGYIYFAMAFSLAVELINIRMRLRMRKNQAR
ncbi:TerC family protein [bacterium]|jgi:predicted tellurium resistance membrane protein TerC|nr:TerC family protein [bacterium]